MRQRHDGMAAHPDDLHNKDRLANRRVMIARMSGATVQRTRQETSPRAAGACEARGAFNALDEVRDAGRG